MIWASFFLEDYVSCCMRRYIVADIGVGTDLVKIDERKWYDWHRQRSPVWHLDEQVAGKGIDFKKPKLSIILKQ